MNMKNTIKYLLLGGCILALCACGQSRLDPTQGPDQTSELITFGTSAVQTKGLIEGTGGLDNEKTLIKVFDYLTVGETTVTYIDDEIKGQNADGSWGYVSNSDYHWTKTGTHKFFGYLLTDPDGESLPDNAVVMENDVLTVGPLTMAASNAEQVDFLYSDIKRYTMPERPDTPNKAVNLQMNHLFTALSVEVANKTGDGLTDFSVNFLGFENGLTATVSYGGDSVGEPQYVGGSTTNPFPFGNKTSIGAEGTEFTSLYDTDPYRLLWRQTITGDTKVQVSYKIAVTGVEGVTSITNTVTADLKDVFAISTTEGEKMEEGHKYLLKITVNPSEVRFVVLVDPLVEHYYDGDNYADYLIKF